jgi:hypothetical protein
MKNLCAWPDCQTPWRGPDFPPRQVLLIEPCPEHPNGVSICTEHHKFINTLFLLMQLHISKAKSGERKLLGWTPDNAVGGRIDN